MAKPGKPIPEGYHSLTPYLVVRGASAAVDFYKRVFGAQENSRMPAADGQRVMHAELTIGDSKLMLCDEFPEMGGCRAPEAGGGVPVSLFLYVLDVDATVQRAVNSGAKIKMPVSDMFWGDRYGRITDPFGHEWSIATHKEDLTPAEMAQRAEAFFSKKK